MPVDLSPSRIALNGRKKIAFQALRDGRLLSASSPPSRHAVAAAIKYLRKENASMAWNRRQVEAPRGTPGAAFYLVFAEQAGIVEHLRAAPRLAQLFEASVNLLDRLGRFVPAPRRAALVQEREELVDDDASRTRERCRKALCLVHGAGQGEQACSIAMVLASLNGRVINVSMPQCAKEPSRPQSSDKICRS